MEVTLNEKLIKAVMIKYMKRQKILNIRVLKSQKKQKHYRSCTEYLKCMRIQQVHASSLHQKYALQNKFLNLFPLSLSSYTPKLKTFIEMLNSYQIITSFGSYKILTT